MQTIKGAIDTPGGALGILGTLGVLDREKGAKGQGRVPARVPSLEEGADHKK